MHPEIIKDEPGDCPKCGMNLVYLKEPDSKIEADSISPTIDHSKMKMPADKAGPSGGEDKPMPAIPKMGKQQYTCSMHPQVIKDEPGKCPYCGMVLILLKKNHSDKGGHNKHVNMIDDFKKRFYVVFILTIPIMLLSPMIQLWLKVDWQFPGSQYVLFALSSIVFFYGGWPFLKGLVDEAKAKSPGMMFLIGFAISVAYIYSVAVVFGLQGMDYFWELATLILIMPGLFAFASSTNPFRKGQPP